MSKIEGKGEEKREKEKESFAFGSFAVKLHVMNCVDIIVRTNE